MGAARPSQWDRDGALLTIGVTVHCALEKGWTLKLAVRDGLADQMSKEK